MPAVYHLIRLLATIVLRWRLQLRVEGAAHVPGRGGVIVAANHRSYLDFLVLGATVPRRLVFLVAAEYFARPAARRVLRFFGAIPAERRRPDASAVGTVRTALRVLRDGGAVAIFPEGWATTEGLPPRAGVALLAAQSGAPVLPVAIVGTDRVWPRGQRRPHRHPVRVCIGAPLTFAADGSPEAYGDFAQRLMREIARLHGGVAGESMTCVGVGA